LVTGSAKAAPGTNIPVLVDAGSKTVVRRAQVSLIAVKPAPGADGARLRCYASFLFAGSFSEEYHAVTNRLQEAIERNDSDQAARIIQEALGIGSDDVANYCFPINWPADREQRARIIGEWLEPISKLRVGVGPL